MRGVIGGNGRFRGVNTALALHAFSCCLISTAWSCLVDPHARPAPYSVGLLAYLLCTQWGRCVQWIYRSSQRKSGHREPPTGSKRFEHSSALHLSFWGFFGARAQPNTPIPSTALSAEFYLNTRALVFRRVTMSERQSGAERAPKRLSPGDDVRCTAQA